LGRIIWCSVVLVVRLDMTELSIQSILLAERFGIRILVAVVLRWSKPPDLLSMDFERFPSWAGDIGSHVGGSIGTEVGWRNDQSRAEASRKACQETSGLG